MSNQFSMTGSVSLKNAQGITTELNNDNTTSDCIFSFPVLPPGDYTLFTGSGSGLNTDAISEATPGNGILITGALKVDTILGKTSSNNVTIGNLLYTDGTLSSVGTNKSLNLNATGTGTIVCNNSISTGNNINIPETTSTAGQIVQNGVPIFHTYGSVGNNCFVGKNCGNLTNNSNQNVGVGNGCLQSITIGSKNVALGYNVLNGDVTGSFNVGIGNNVLNGEIAGSYNTAIGNGAMELNSTSGSENVGLGASACRSITSGARNIAIGNGSLQSSTTSSFNTAIGYLAGNNYTSGSEQYNTLIGYGNVGTAGESFTSRIGSTNAATTYLYGVLGANPGTNANIVGVSSTNQMGTTSTNLTTNSTINTTANYKVSGNTIADASGFYITNGGNITTLASAGNASCTFNLPNKSFGTYTIATTSDVQPVSSYFSIQVNEANYNTILLANTMTGISAISVQNTATARNFAQLSNTQFSFSGTSTINAKVTGVVSFIAPANDAIISLFLTNSTSPVCQSQVSTVANGNPLIRTLSISVLTSLSNGSVLELNYRSSVSQTLTTKCIMFNALSL